MALSYRPTRPASTSLKSLLDILGYSAARPPSRCPACFRAFSSGPSLRQSSRRHLQTATAYQPSNFPTEPPPRNVGVPNTSIAGDTLGRSDTVTDRTKVFKGTTITGWGDTTGTTIPEEEAQKTKAAAPAPSTSTSSTKPRGRRYTFKPQKATITLTKEAVLHLRRLLDQPEPKLIRVGTKAKGCSGLAYDLEYVDKPSLLDETVEQDGVKVLIDNKALINIIGSEMDWVEDKLSARFVFKNPNITEQCGCGESFSVR